MPVFSKFKVSKPNLMANKSASDITEFLVIVVSLNNQRI